MATFTLVVLIIFVGALAIQFIKAIETDCMGLAVMFGVELMAFAYLAKVLM